MVKALCEDKWPKTASLKEYLLYSADGLMDDDGEALEWYQETFPENMQLQWTYDMYQRLAARLQQT